MTHIIPSAEVTTPEQALLYYQSLSELRHLIDCVVDDALKKGFQVVTKEKSSTSNDNLDDSIGREIENKLFELNIQDVLKKVLLYERIYSNGCLVYFCIDSNVPQIDLSKPIEGKINKIMSINVLKENQFSVQYKYDSVLSSKYNEPTFIVGGKEIHHSRCIWIVRNLIS